jgi:hypothetical protein
MRPDMGPDKQAYCPVPFLHKSSVPSIDSGIKSIMKLDLTLIAAALRAGGVDGLDLKAEHAGGIFNRVHGGKSCSDDGVINNGTASGQTVALGNGMVCSRIVIRDFNI